jgi:hypothetical protein
MEAPEYFRILAQRADGAFLSHCAIQHSEEAININV